MKKTIATVVTLSALCAFSANAHEFNNEQCDVDINGDIKFADRILTLKTDENKEVVITSDYSLFIDGDAVQLSAKEQQWVGQYYNGIQESIPQVMTVAAEGVKIANYAVSEVLRGFLGEQSEVANKMEEKLDTLYDDLKTHVYQNPESLTFDTQVIEDDIGLGADFEKEIDLFVSEVMEQAMGEFFIQMGKSMLSGESSDSMASFETRMEQMGENIETKIEGKTELIEREAEKLCEMISNIDATESKLQKIKGLTDLNLIRMNEKA